jgi:serine/threonine protein kinase/Tol biopolymer transport system component
MIDPELSSFGDFRLGDWFVQPRLIRITRSGSTVSIELKMMQVLVCLAKHAGDLVSRQQLIDTVWATEFISEGVLTRIIAELRKALGDDAREPSYIETIHGRGYRLLIKPSVVSDEESSIAHTVSHFLLLDHIGAGGMGVVYRAHDRRLDRDVAIKMLPEDVARDEDRRARFEREAKLLASLNHPNIATLHGLEEHEGQLFLVMEFAEGETLAERVMTGSIPTDEALPIALQIAQALEAAHEHGIIHRDLKPANVMVNSEGQVKVLDFGLAKAFEPEGSGPQSPESLAESPTLTADLTRGGVLLGTAAYMSPEQARGKAVDKRADVWAFGCVLYEMLTGTRAFAGETSTEVLAAIIKEEPDWGVFPAEAPGPVRRLLRRCLTKDPRDRLHDVADARLEIEEAIAQPDEVDTEEAQPSLRARLRATRLALLAAIVVSVAVIGGMVWKLSEVRSTIDRSPMRLALSLPPGVTIHALYSPVLAVSPDGHWLVFAASKGDTRRLYRRSVEQFDAAPIQGTEGGEHPFFSPDGRWVGFFADDKLKKIPLAGGPPQVLADASNPWGATWGADGTIVYCPRDTQGLWRVAATGGAPEKIASPQPEQGEFDLNWPEFLPNGKAVLFTAWRGMTADAAQVCVLDLESRARKTLTENASYARYVPTGHLIFGHEGAVHIVPFDAERREVTGSAVPLPEPIFYDSELGLPYLAFSAGGVLAFVPGGGVRRCRLVSVNLAGAERPLIDALRGFMYPRFSPDGERLAVTISEPGDMNIWVIDLATGAQTKLTQEGANVFPSWTPDGERVTYLSIRGGNEFSINWKRADGHGESEALVSQGDPGEVLGPGSWSPDGKTLVYFRDLPSQPENGKDIWMVDRDGDREARPLVATRAGEKGAAISPDGEWLAYTSNESGQWEIYVQPFPAGGVRHQVSAAGGENPVWSPDGSSIYYRAIEGGQFAVSVLTAPVTTKPRFRAGAPQVLFEERLYEVGTYGWGPIFDIAPDGKSFAMVKADESWGRASEVRVVLNWFDELKRLAPAE